jgi:hypothetical protein
MMTTTTPFSELATEISYRLLQVVINHTVEVEDGDDNNTFSNITAAVPTTTTTLSHLTSDSSSSNSNSSSISGNTDGNNFNDYQVLMSVLWYLFLAMLCFIPTFCLYRRHCPLWEKIAHRFRSTTTTSATTFTDQQLHHQQQQQQFADAITIERLQLLQRQMQERRHHYQHDLYSLPTLSQQQQELLLRTTAQDLIESEMVVVEWTRRIEESLHETTFMVQERDITIVQQSVGVVVVAKGDENESQAKDQNDDDEDGKIDQNINHSRTTVAATSTIPRTLHDMEEAGLADLDVASILHLPKTRQGGNQDHPHADRNTVPGVCAICLCGYHVGDRVTWSKQLECQHAFHHHCIVTWLAKNYEGNPKCPCCRQVYCTIQPISFQDLLYSARINHPDITTTTSPAAAAAAADTIHDSPITPISATTTLTPLDSRIAVRSGGSSRDSCPHEYQNTADSSYSSSLSATMTTTNRDTSQDAPNSDGGGGYGDIEEGMNHNVDGNGSVTETTVADNNGNNNNNNNNNNSSTL